MARRRHPNKEIEAAIQYAEGRGWTVILGGSHAWGKLYCPHHDRDGCKKPIWSTPRHPEMHARSIIKEVDDCPHREEAP